MIARFNGRGHPNGAGAVGAGLSANPNRPPEDRPMTDSVERLRAGEPCNPRCGVMDARSGCCCATAAEEIERLRAALREIKQMGEGKVSALPLLAWRCAAEALGELGDAEQSARGDENAT